MLGGDRGFRGSLSPRQLDKKWVHVFAEPVFVCRRGRYSETFLIHYNGVLLQVVLCQHTERQVC